MILVPPTTLRLEVREFSFTPETPQAALSLWNMWYVSHSLRPRVQGDLVTHNPLLVQCAIILNIPIIECREETRKFDYKRFTRRFKEIAKRARTSGDTIPKYQSDGVDT